jgi:glucose/arabinose dehydrogenase
MRFCVCDASLRLLVLALACLRCTVAAAAPLLEAPPANAEEQEYYRIVTIPIPKDIVLEAGAMEWLPNGRLAVATRRGEIYLVENVLSDPPKDVRFSRFASGLHEILGLAQKDGVLYAAQRGELTRVADTNHDGVADSFETVADGWGITGDYHEYTFGSHFDRNGDLWLTLCLTGSFSSPVKYRGWCLRYTADGKLVPVCGGIRSPGGMGINAEGDVFYTDNQGPWNGVCSLKHLAPGSFQGHPDSLRWCEEGTAPKEPESGSRMHSEAEKIPELMPPPVLFPYPKMGQSAAGIECDLTGGKFGPFEKQMFVADQSHSTVMRVFLEKVDGRYQGACFMLREGFSSGNLSLLFAPDGSLLVYGTNRGWGSRGRESFALERMIWTGTQPFEVLEMHARHDGFELMFTEAVDPKTASDTDSYDLKTYTYIYQKTYGSPEVDATTPEITKAVVGSDGKSVRLHVDELQLGHVHELHLDGVRSAGGKPLVHAAAYYTMNHIPSK